ncbi:class B sortase [Clostridium sp.]|uniref:class B sortase n=1 Tax=Clostridium sp. TaxID=1506 RepID=UPI0026301D49|nr:class B sortase [Clostridium sp.]
MKTRSRKIINAVLILIILFCGLKIFQKYHGYYTDYKSYEKLRNYSPVSDSNSTNNTTKESKSDSTKEKNLKDINSDYVFWIKVSGTNIDFPVVQGKDNDFYLKHDFDKKKSFSGSIFVDYKNNINKDKNVIIFGHNMRNDTMFAQMNQFENENFFKNNKYVTIYKDGKEKQYEIFSVYLGNAKKLKIDPTFSSNEDYENYLKKQKELSLFKRNINLSSNDKIITLVTCNYDFDDARLVVVAKEL